MANLNIDLNLVVAKANANLTKLTKQAETADRRFANLEKSVGGIRSNLSLLTGVAAGIGLFKLADSALELGGSALSAAGNLETLRTQFEVLTQSGAKANTLIQDLVNFTAKTPFQLEGVSRAAQRLISFGFEVDNIQDKLQVLGDVAAASNADLGEMALIFGQVRAAGKLTGERLLQLQERAIPIGPALAKTLGVAESAVRDLVSQGKVDFATFEKAFESLNNKGEFAFEGMIKRSRTLEGRVSTLKDNLNLLSSDAGSKLLPAFKGLITTATILVDRIRNNAEVMAFFGNVSNAIPGIIQKIGDTLIFFNNIIQESRKFINSYRAAWNSVAIVVIDAIKTLVDGARAVSSFLNIDISPLNAVSETLGIMKESLSEVAVESLEANKAIEDSQNKINQAISESTKFTIDTINEEIEAAKKQADVTEETNQRMIDSGKALTAEQLKDIEEKRKAQEKLNEQLTAARALSQQQAEAIRLFDAEQEQIFLDERLIQLQDYFTREEEAILQAKLNSITNETEKQLAIEAIVSDGLKRRLKLKQQEIEAEKKLETERKQAILTQTGNLFGSLSALAAAGGKDLFETSKAFSIAESTIKGYQAVQNALAQVPYPANLIAAASIGIRTAANIARISSTSPPGFEDGGFVGGRSFTGDNVPIRVNSGEAVLNARQQRNFMALANGQSQSGPKEFVIRNMIHLDGRQIAENVSRHVADGLELGEFI